VTRSVWITGARGFIGRHLARHLSATGARVAGVGHGHWPDGEAAAAGVSEWINGEVGPASLELLLQHGGIPDAVLHLAGGSAVGPSFANPLEDYERTATTTASLLDWVRRRAPQAHVVAVSSAAVYGAGHDGPIDEHASSAPFSPYGYHKAIMEMLCRSYVQNFGLRVSIARVFSAYGEGLRKQLLWDLCCRLEAAPLELVLDGTGEERRDWLHVDDVVRALDAIARSPAHAECQVVNVGTGAGHSVEQVARQLLAAWGTDCTLAFSGRVRAGDPRSLVAAPERLRALGFAPAISLEQGMTRYVGWFRAPGGR
jgi:UDP-glucose 4-epimerase